MQSLSPTKLVALLWPIVVKQGKLSQLDTGDKMMGRGVGSIYLPVCEMHRANYPDHDGFELDGKTKLS